MVPSRIWAHLSMITMIQLSDIFKSHVRCLSGAGVMSLLHSLSPLSQLAVCYLCHIYNRARPSAAQCAWSTEYERSSAIFILWNFFFIFEIFFRLCLHKWNTVECQRDSRTRLRHRVELSRVKQGTHPLHHYTCNNVSHHDCLHHSCNSCRVRTM